MSRLIGKQRQDEKLQIARGELATHAHASPAWFSVVHESAAEAAKAMAPVVVAPHKVQAVADRSV
jgi:hypothetical protein